MRKLVFVVGCLVFTCWVLTNVPQTAAQSAPQGSTATQTKPDPWAAWRYLVGEWIGAGTGTPGEATGGFTFGFDLDSAVLVRRNYAEYPATKDRPAFRHDDLLIVYPGADSLHGSAIYFDNEKHVIRYATEFTPDRKLLTFLSDPSQPGPRFRMSYEKLTADTLGIKFDVAPPAKPEAFSTYITAKAYRAGKK